MILICLRFICSNYYIKILNYICEKCPMCLSGNIKRIADVIFFHPSVDSSLSDCAIRKISPEQRMPRRC